jgi:phage-related protein
MNQEKEIRWVGSSYDDLLAFPDEPRRQAGFQLAKVQAGLDPDNWNLSMVSVHVLTKFASRMLRVCFA